MPLVCKRRQSRLSAKTASACRNAPSSALARVFLELEPGAPALARSKGSIVSSRPPVALTTGTVP